jgi:hypothetical protein
MNYFCPNHDNPNQTKTICLWHDGKFFHLSKYLLLKACNFILLICNQTTTYHSGLCYQVTISWKAIPSDNARKAFALS